MLQSIHWGTALPTEDGVKGGIEVRKFVDLEFPSMGRWLGLCHHTRHVTARVGSETLHTPGWYPIAHLSLAHSDSLERVLLDADGRALRFLLSKKQLFTSSLSDRQVRVALAQHIVRGDYGLYQLVREPLDLTSGSRGQQKAVDVAAPAPALAPTPALLQPASFIARPGSTLRKVESMEPAPEPPVDQMKRIDHAAQAAVLVNAARYGTAFCEECALRKSKRDALLAQ